MVRVGGGAGWGAWAATFEARLCVGTDSSGDSSRAVAAALLIPMCDSSLDSSRAVAAALLIPMCDSSLDSSRAVAAARGEGEGGAGERGGGLGCDIQSWDQRWD